MNGKIILGAVAAVVLALGGVTSCSRVEPGNVGVEVSRTGSNSGVNPVAKGVGYYLTGFGTNIYEYPIFTNNYSWDNSLKCNEAQECEGRNEEFSFQDKNGLVVTADVSIAYRVDPSKAPVLFQKYRTDMDGIVAGPLRNAVRSALVDSASNMSVEEIYGPGKSRLISSALANVRKYFAPQGLVVEQLYWAGPIRIPGNILERINARAQNEQAAIAAQANVARFEAEARSKVAVAEGEAQAVEIAAKAEAEAMRIKSAALSSNPNLIEYEKAQRWNGVMPSTVYCSSSTPCMGN